MVEHLTDAEVDGGGGLHRLGRMRTGCSIPLVEVPLVPDVGLAEAFG